MEEVGPPMLNLREAETKRSWAHREVLRAP